MDRQAPFWVDQFVTHLSTSCRHFLYHYYYPFCYYSRMARILARFRRQRRCLAILRIHIKKCIPLDLFNQLASRANGSQFKK